jgi:hypothetical protein
MKLKPKKLQIQKKQIKAGWFYLCRLIFAVNLKYGYNITKALIYFLLFFISLPVAFILDLLFWLGFWILVGIKYIFVEVILVLFLDLMKKLNSEIAKLIGKSAYLILRYAMFVILFMIVVIVIYKWDSVKELIFTLFEYLFYEKTEEKI